MSRPSRASDRPQTPAAQPVKGVGLPIRKFVNIKSLNRSKIRKLCRVDREIQRRCTMCDSAPVEKWACPRCKLARYCSWECQVDDNEYHVKICRAWRLGGDWRKRPSKWWARAVVFPAQTVTPIVRWVRITESPKKDKKKAKDGKKLKRKKKKDGKERRVKPLLYIKDGEITEFLRQLKRQYDYKPEHRLRCVNSGLEAYRPERLGHGLFLLEWRSREGIDVEHGWANQSIAGLAPPGRLQQWTGPVVLLALDLRRCSVKRGAFLPDDVDMRDFRHAVDYLLLNPCNPCLPHDAIASSRLLRSPGDPPAVHAVHAVKLNDVHSTVNVIMGVTEPIEDDVNVRANPYDVGGYHDSGSRGGESVVLEGPSTVCVALGLDWVVRTPLQHHASVQWLYEDHLDSLPWFTRVLTEVWRVDDNDATPTLRTCSLANIAGDGLLVMHASGAKICREHVEALKEYLSPRPDEAAEDSVRAKVAADPNGFRTFWDNGAFWGGDYYGDMPSPYDARLFGRGEPGSKSSVVCGDVFALLDVADAEDLRNDMLQRRVNKNIGN
ncbi:hypothetical protein B0T26DRAFT_671408 [Lasiosphaeria miniovina]|uniref:MYND-type domain-containing protein n=1 Tax=Lasiosphaeria miniovina TaxID=1954250 RepID=A0AA40BJ89_9PEZI|nr:uncharacterized protein B0T26DRAFT_671408 [Lasiosphaeria miniovina]KAK0735240.1 hypothetical protein B0T26DRAFT_671408 [Lasiosphaeria miniovina]